MNRNIKKLLLFSLILFAIVMISTCVNAATIKETTKTNDGNDTIESGTIVVGITKFTPSKIVTGVKVAIAGANDAKAYIAANGSDKNYSYPKMYYYLLGDWYEYTEEGELKISSQKIDSMNIYYVDNKLKQGITLPTKPAEKAKYEVVFMDGSKVVKTEQVEEGSKVSKPEALSKEGYNFKGWYNNGVAYDFSREVISTIVLTAEWEKIPEKTKYTVFFIDGETVTSKKEVDDGDKVGELPTLTKENFTYTWVDKDGNKVTENTIIKNDTTIFANWKENQKATMTLKVDDKEKVINKYVGETVQVDDPTKEGNDSITYTFNGWYTEDGEKYTITTMPEQDIVLIAGWDVIINKDKNVNLTTVINQVSNESTPSTITIEDNLKVTEDLTIAENTTLVIDDGKTLTIGKDTKIENTANITKGEGAKIQKEADDEASIVAGIETEYADEVVLTNNITLNNELTVTDGVIDLNGKEIVADNDNVIYTTGEVTLKGGTISSNSEDITIINSGNLVADDLTINQYYGICNNNGASLNISNSEINVKSIGILGESSGAIAIFANSVSDPANGATGTTQGSAAIKIVNSTIKSEKDAAIYFTNSDTLEIIDSTIEGLVGIEARAGKINVVNSTIISTGSQKVYSDSDLFSAYDAGTSATCIGENGESSGSAIFFVIQEPYGAGTEGTITIDDKSTLKGVYGIRVYKSSVASESDSVKSVAIDSKAKFEGTEESHSFDAGITSIVKTSDDLKNAIANSSIKEIILENDITVTESCTKDTESEVVINTNNHKITKTNTGSIFIVKKGILELTGDGEMQGYAEIVTVYGDGEVKVTGNGTYNCTDYPVLCSGSAKKKAKGGKITIESGNFIGVEGCVNVQNGGEVNISGGVFTATDNAVIAGNGTYADQDFTMDTIINITGGTFNAGIKTNGWIAMGIYHPQKGTLNVTGGTFEIAKGSGIVMRSGTLAKLTGVTFNYNHAETDKDFTGWAGDKKSKIPVGKDVVKCTHDVPSGYAYDVELSNVDAKYSVLEFAE